MILEINVCKIGFFIFSMSFEEHFLKIFLQSSQLSKVFFFLVWFGRFCVLSKNYFSNLESQRFLQCFLKEIWWFYVLQCSLRSILS